MHVTVICTFSTVRKKGVGLICLKCDTADCKGTAKIDQGLLYTMNDHDNHQTMEREIAELSALERMRKRATDDESTSLRLGCATHLLSEQSVIGTSSLLLLLSGRIQLPSKLNWPDVRLFACHDPPPPISVILHEEDC